MLKEARDLARRNVEIFHPLVSECKPLIGLEPSAILGFVDEYPDLLRAEMKEKAQNLAPHCWLIDEFISREFESGRISAALFSAEKRRIRLHGHWLPPKKYYPYPGIMRYC
jgi:Fe-S oxidoreductase